MPVTGTAGACVLPRIVGNHHAPTTWNGQFGRNGDREYKVTYRVQVATTMGPAKAVTAVGLPLPGDPWVMLGDVDIYAFCTPEVGIKPVHEAGDPNTYFDLEYTYSTGPADQCYTAYANNPLLRSPKVSGGFNRFTKPATFDRFGAPIVSSSFEKLTGPNVEFDENRPTVRVEQNVLTLGLAFIESMMDCVNAYEMWGFSPRCVKLSGCTWERKFLYDCSCYFTRTLEFDINRLTFDRDILDEGTKALHGKWNEVRGHWEVLPIGIDPGTLAVIMPNAANPNHFTRFTDRAGNVTRVILNRGKPYDPYHVTTGTDDDAPGYIHVEKYTGVDLMLLGLPATLECTYEGVLIT